MSHFWLIAVRSLWQHRRRSLLLGGAIAGVTALLVVMLSLFNGIRSTILESATTVMTGHLNVGGFYKVTAGQSSPVVTRYREVVALVEKEIPEIEYVAQRGRGWAKLVSDVGAMQAGITGVDIESEPGLRRVLVITSGRLADLASPRTMLVFEDQAKRLGVRVGDRLTISAPTFRGVNNTLDVTIVAVARNIGLLSQFSTFVPNSAIRELYQLNDDTAGALHLYLRDMRDVARIDERLRQVLAASGFELLDKDPRAFWFKFDVVNREAWTGQKLDVTTWEDEISFIKTTVTALTLLGDALIFILLIVISVGIMNTLWIAIRERTREIGTLRAIGMRRLRVVQMFVSEAFLLSLGSTLAGVAAGIAVCLTANAAAISVPTSVQLFLMREQLVFELLPESIAGGVLLIVGCTTAIALIPSLLAARLRPVTAMSQVG